MHNKFSPKQSTNITFSSLEKKADPTIKSGFAVAENTALSKHPHFNGESAEKNFAEIQILDPNNTKLSTNEESSRINYL